MGHSAKLLHHAGLWDCSLLSPPFGISPPPPHPAPPHPCCSAGQRNRTLPAFLLVFLFYLLLESLVMEGCVTRVRTWHTQKCGAPFSRTPLSWLCCPRGFTGGSRERPGAGERTQVHQMKEVQSGQFQTVSLRVIVSLGKGPIFRVCHPPSP